MNTFTRGGYHYKAWYRRFFIMLFDLAGSLLVLPLRLLRLPHPSEYRKILLIRNDHLGDVIMTLPALRQIRQRYPKAEIHLATTPEACTLLQYHPDITRLIEWKHHWFTSASLSDKLQTASVMLNLFRKESYDLAIDFRGDLRNILLMTLANAKYRVSYGVTGGRFLLQHCPPYPKDEHQVATNLKLLHALNIQTQLPRKIDLPVSFDQKEKAFKLLPSAFRASKKPVLILHTQAGYPSKCWPHERFIELLSKILAAKICKVILIGTDAEKKTSPFSAFQHSELLDLRGMTPLNYLPAVIALGDCYLGHDSGPAHIAAAVGLPLIVLFSGTNQAQIWKPWSDRLHLIQHEVPCSPCEAKICPLGHHDCMRHIQVETVYQSLCNLIQHSDKGRSQ